MPAQIYGNQSGTVGLINAATAQNSTSGTNIEFTGIPSGVKRITVSLQGVSTNGTSPVQVQIGSGTYTTSGYACASSSIAGSTVASAAPTTGFQIYGAGFDAATGVRNGALTLTNVSGNVWVCSGTIGWSNTTGTSTTGGSVTISGTLDRVRLTTVNGTDAFDAGSVNILYE